MKQGLAGAEKGHSLGRSQGSLYGNKEELYDRLKRHAYQPGQGKKGEWFSLWEAIITNVVAYNSSSFLQTRAVQMRQQVILTMLASKEDSRQKIVRRLSCGKNVASLLVTNCYQRLHPSDYHKPRKHKLYPYKVETLWGVRTSWICNVLNAQLFGWCL